ncbi:MAG: hypothetical protein Q8S73_18920 [Deltaproteobacteria bacterium]|nr:hypothetical protein [Myxococcales bacterium]MDP3216188.1 hypothetical protein [Deltaproteobacteria bacterium]
MAAQGQRGVVVALVVGLGLGCGDAGGTEATGGAADAGCAWGRCAADATAGPRCVATGVADGSWLTADWDDGVYAPDCTRVPAELREAWTPGRYVEGDGSIGEILCEGLRPGAATLRARVRVRMLASQPTEVGDCQCGAGWNVAMHVLVEGQEARSIEGLIGGLGVNESCRTGPDVTQEMPVTVGADGRLRARLELGRCRRPGATACVFLRGTGVGVVQ